MTQAKASLEEKNSTLLETVARLKEEARGSETRRAGLEADLRRLQEEHSDLVRRAASAEASLQVASRVRMCFLLESDIVKELHPLDGSEQC